MSVPSPRRPWALRNLELSQKLLAFTIVASVGFGYLGALAQLFSAHAHSDGKSTITLEQFPQVLREKGVRALVTEIEASLGKDDVVKSYHGSGAAVTRLAASLNGTMRRMILNELTNNKPETADEDTKKLAEELRVMLQEWSRLPEELRKKAYSDGVPTNPDTGAADLVKFVQLFGEPAEEKKENAANIELTPLITDTLQTYCVTCHSGGSPDPQAKKIPLQTFAEVNAFCNEDRGISVKQLALSTHVHLLGFATLYAITGFLFTLTSFPAFIRVIFAPWTLFFTVVEIACWWLAKLHVFYAEMIFYLGPIIAVGLAIQLFGVMFDLIFRRPEPLEPVVPGLPRR